MVNVEIMMDCGDAAVIVLVEKVVIIVVEGKVVVVVGWESSVVFVCIYAEREVCVWGRGVVSVR